MTSDYCNGQLLSASQENGSLILRVDVSENADYKQSGKPVLALTLENCANASAATELLSQYTCSFIEFYVEEEEHHKYLDTTLEYHMDTDIRIEFTELHTTFEDHTTGDLMNLYSFLKRIHQRDFEDHNRTEQKYREIIEGLRRVLIHEVETTTRKAKFFATSSKGARFERERILYQELLDRLHHLENGNTTAA